MQDLLGTKLIDLFLEESGENIDSLTMLDKIHKLEKLQMIESAEVWKLMRNARNHIAHEYPDNPEIVAKYLTQIFDLTQSLLDILNAIKIRGRDFS